MSMYFELDMLPVLRTETGKEKKPQTLCLFRVYILVEEGKQIIK